MQFHLTEQQRAESLKILKYLRRMESIVQTSSNPEQRARIQKDMLEYKRELESFFPGADIQRENVEAIISSLGLAETISEEERSAPPSLKDEEGSLLSHLETKKASIDCNHSEVNLIYTVLHRIGQIYWPVLSKFALDYNYLPKKNSLQLKLENSLRSISSFTKIAEDKGYNSALQGHAGQIKAHSARKILMESDDFFKDMRSFLSVLLEDMRIKETLQKRTQQEVKKLKIVDFSKFSYQELARWENKTVYELISELHQLCEELISYLSVPSMRL